MSESGSIFIYGINYAPEVTGVGRYTADIAQYLAEKDSVVEVVTAAPHYPGWKIHSGFKNRFSKAVERSVLVWRCPLILREKSVGIWRLVPPLSFAILSAPLAAWRILRQRPTTVLCIEPTLLTAPIALMAAKLVGAKTVLHIQDLEFDAAFAVGHLRSQVLQRIAAGVERLILRHFDTIITISRQMRERILSKKVDPARVKVVRNWVDLDKIKPMNLPSSYRKELGFSVSDFVVLYAGNIGPKQALPVLLEAADQLNAHSDIKFVLAGDGPEKERLIAQFGGLPNVHFLSVQPEDSLCDLLNLPNVHVLPAQKGTADLVLPSKLGGMLASGKPSIVLAEPRSELHEFLEGCAFLFPPGDSTVLAKAILELYQKPDISGDLQWSAKVNELSSVTNLATFRFLLLDATCESV